MPSQRISAILLTSDRKRLSLYAYLFLALVCIGFFTPGIVNLPPTDRDESSFAQASKQMIESGNYVDIRIQDTPRYKKPIGIYWLQATSVKLFNAAHLGEIWAYRIPSYLSAIIAVLVTAALGSLLFGPVAGFLAAIMMAGCVSLNVEARLAKTDSTLLATIMVAQYAMAQAYLKQARRYLTPFLFWTAVGAGILVKGPIILLVILSTLLWLHIEEKNLKWFKVLRPWEGMLYAAVLTLPWLIIAGIETHGQFYQQSAGHDMFGKILNGEFRGIMPPGLHLLFLPAMFFPFSGYAFLGAPDAWKNRREHATRFCLGWIIPTWIIFEMSLTKLPHYVLPTYPPIAMLAARALLDGYPSLATRRWRWVPPLTLGIWLTIGSGIALTPVLGSYMINHAWNPLQIVASVILLLALGAATFFLFQRKKDGVLFLAAGGMIFSACVFGYTVPNLQHLWLSREVVQMADAAKPCKKLEIVSATYNEPSFIFLAGTKTEFTPSGSIAAFDIWANPCKIVVTDDDHDKYFLDAFTSKAYKPIVIGTVKGYNAGRGNSITLTLYKLPLRKKAP